MRRILPLLLFVILPLIACSKPDIINGEESTVSEIEGKLLNTGLNLVKIYTVDSEMPSCEYVSAPEGSMGRGIRNAKKVKGRLIIKQGPNVLYDSGDFIENESGMTIKIRGNSSAYTEKKPYKIQLQKKKDLLFRDAKYEDKSWVLIKDSEAMTLKDEMSLKPLIGMKVAELIGMQYVPRGMYVNVLINDQYKGIYFLSENVKRNKQCRVDVEKGKGFIIEFDPYWWNEPVSFETTITSPSFKYTFKEPDNDELDADMLSYVQETMLQMEGSLNNESYPSYLDITSFAKWILAHDILGTDDGGGINKFLTKKDNTAKTLVEIGPLWDFDGIMKLQDTFSLVHEDFPYNLYYSWLFKSQQFIDAYVLEWEKVSMSFCENLIGFLENYSDKNGNSLDASRELEHELCGIDFQSVSENVDYARSFFHNRMAWLNTIVPIYKTTNIASPIYYKSKEEPVYNLSGVKIQNRNMGVCIVNGRLFLDNK